MSLPPKSKAVLIDGISDTYEVIKYQDIDTPTIEGPHDIIVNNKFSGVNFIETYFRKGYYKSQPPLILGREASGIIVAVGEEVKNFKVGDKVVYNSPNTFAEYTKITDSHVTLFKLPDDISEQDFKLFGSFTVQSLTAYAFVVEPYKPKEGEFVLVWAAAGGVGQILVQILSQRGVNVIALASNQDKLELVKSLGAQYAINYKTEDVVSRVQEITNGKGVKVSYDSVGKGSFQTSIDSLSVGGILISYGNSSGKVEPVDFYSLPPKNIAVLRPMVFVYTNTNEIYSDYLNQVIDDYRSGKVKYFPPEQYDLKDYAEVAKKLESGSTTGKFVLKI